MFVGLLLANLHITVEAYPANGIAADPARTAACAIHAVSLRGRACCSHRVSCPKSRLIQIFRLPCRALHCGLCSNRAACIMFVWSTRGTSPSLEQPLLRCFGALQEPAGTSTSGQSPVTLQSGKDSTGWAGRTENRLVAAAAASVGMSRLSFQAHLACTPRCGLRRNDVCGSSAVKPSHQHHILRSDGDSNRSSLVSCMFS